MDQYNTEIFSCFLLLLPSYSSTLHQTNVEDTQNGSEDNLFFSRIQSLHHLLDVLVFHDEENESISSKNQNRWVNIFLVQISVQVLSPIGIVVFVDKLAEVRLCGFALTFDLLAKSPAFNFSTYSSNCISEVSCSLSSWSLLFNFVTNLFLPWEILTHEWELSLFIDSIPISTPCLPCRQQVVTSNTGPILVFSRIQPFGLDELASLGNVYSRQATESVNCENSSVSFVMKYCPTSIVVRSPASIQNLLTLSCCDNFSIRSLYHRNRSSSCARSSV